MWQEAVTTEPQSACCKNAVSFLSCVGECALPREGERGGGKKGRVPLKRAGQIGLTTLDFAYETTRADWFAQMVGSLCLLPLLGIFCQDREPAACQSLGARNKGGM